MGQNLPPLETCSPHASVRNAPLFAFYLQEILVIYEALKMYRETIKDEYILSWIDYVMPVFKHVAENSRTLGLKK